MAEAIVQMELLIKGVGAQRDRLNLEMSPTALEEFYGEAVQLKVRMEAMTSSLQRWIAEGFV